MLNIRFLLLAPIFLATLTSAATPIAKGTCEKQYRELQTNPLFPTTASKIKVFESYAFMCAGSGLYEARLANLYMLSDSQNLSKAKQILDDALRHSLPHRPGLLEKQAIFYQLSGDLTHAQEVDRLLIHDYPNSHEGYSGLAASLFALGKIKESIELYEKANSLQPTSVGYRGLVIAYTLDRRYPDASKAFDQYFRRDSSAFGDRDAVMAVSYAYERQDELELADGTLRGLLKAKPQVKDDQAFVKLFRKVNLELGQNK
jgi:tetratricopeptide (TPR) repeat protein